MGQDRRPTGLIESRLILAGLCGVLLFVSAINIPGQDWVPFQAAAALAREGAWRDVYPVDAARGLFDATPRFREEVLALGMHVPEDGITGFVSPPPAALMLAPFGARSPQAANALWRLLLSIPVSATLLAFASARVRAGAPPWLWTRLCLLGGVLLFYTVGAGQPSAWLVVAAALSVMPPSRTVDACGGVALALGCLTKATPLLVVAGLWVAGRRRLAAIAAVCTVVAAVGTLPWTGTGAWALFVRSAVQIGRHVMTDWNNASFDALVLRVTSGRTDSTFQTAGPAVAAVSWIVRVVLVGWAALVAARGSAPQRRAAAVWVGWLASTPLLWTHYLAVLFPLLSLEQDRRRVWTTLVPVALIAAGTWLVYINQRSGVVAVLSCAGWLLAAVLVLDGGWPRRAGDTRAEVSRP